MKTSSSSWRTRRCRRSGRRGPTMPETAPPEGGRLRAILEALVFAAEEPLTIDDLVDLFPGADRDALQAALDAVSRACESEERGLMVQRVAGGYRMATKPDVGGGVRALFRSRNRRRLSAQALEPLAIIAYRQPITTPEIQTIRGTDPSSVLEALLENRRRVSAPDRLDLWRGERLPVGDDRQGLERLGRQPPPVARSEQGSHPPTDVRLGGHAVPAGHALHHQSALFRLAGPGHRIERCLKRVPVRARKQIDQIIDRQRLLGGEHQGLENRPQSAALRWRRLRHGRTPSPGSAAASRPPGR